MGVGHDKLVRMAEQIAANLDLGDDVVTAARVADHIGRFWDPRMRETLLAYAASGEAQLSARVREALKQLK